MLNSPTVISEDDQTRCDEFPEKTFLSSPRGCKFYFFCTELRRGEATCPFINGTQLHFHAESESCQLPEDAECNLDEQWRGLNCPEFGFDKIPHPHLCSKYTGEKLN